MTKLKELQNLMDDIENLGNEYKLSVRELAKLETSSQRRIEKLFTTNLDFEEYDDIQKKLADQAKAANANNSNIGAEILRRFNQGQGAENAQRVNGNADNNAARTIPAQANQ